MLWPSEVAFKVTWLEHDRRVAWAWHRMCESNRVAMCKSNWNDIIQIFSNMAWQGMVGAQHGMRELVLTGTRTLKLIQCLYV